MLFKNKNNSFNVEDKMAFDTVRVGANICKLRKKLGITQTELADRLGISFQAVSNWERGNSMPDISKLGELSDILGASIDEILDNERMAHIADAVLNDRPAENVTGEELESIAPMLKDEQVERLVENEKSRIDDIASVAPFLSTEFLDNYAKKKISEGVHPETLGGILPFMSDSALNALADEGLRLHGLQSIAGYLPFLSDSKLDALALKAYEKHKCIESLMPLVPFLNDRRVDDIALRVFNETGSLSRISSIIPFMSDNAVNSIAKQVIDKEGLRGIQELLPFMDSSVLESFFMERE